MDQLSREQLEALAGQQQRICISVFLPTHRAGDEIRQDPIRLKNLLSGAQSELILRGMRRTDASRILSPARQLIKEDWFWRYQSDGLAIYLTPGFFQYFRLPIQFPEQFTISERFDIKPLLPLFTAGGRFYLLGISQNRARLFEGSQYSVSELDLGNAPQGVAEALKYDVRESQQQQHSAARRPGGRTKEEAVFHGQGIGVDDSKDRAQQYFRQIDRALRDLLKDRWAPLVLAGTEEMLALYRQANTYERLVPGGVEGNPDGMGADELKRAAWEVLRPYFEGSRNRAIRDYQTGGGTGRTSNQLPEVLRAAYQGRVEIAFIPPQTERWGHFDPEQDRVEAHLAPEPGDEDLVNAVAVQTVINHGALYTIEPTEIPDASPVAAVLRYAA